jgi:2-octaprenyl-6-methoxyphenol hydroxylase
VHLEVVAIIMLQPFNRQLLRVVVVGGGPVGLMSALALIKAGFETTLIAPAALPPGTGAQARSAALFPGSLNLLRNHGVWDDCLATSSPLRAIRLVDDTGGLLRAPEVLFAAREIGLDAFGHNVPNATLVAALESALRVAHPPFRWIHDSVARGVDDLGSFARVTLTDGSSLDAELVVAADGRNSICRASAGIVSTDRLMDQVAVTAAFTHSRPHDGISTEFHRKVGPCTTVPLPGRSSTLVWVERPALADRLTGLGDAEFSNVLESQLKGVLGSVSDIRGRGRFPLHFMSAERFGANRVILVGEAAHVMPPIGAQGLNLGLRDVGTLIDCVNDAKSEGQDIGGPAVMEAYQRSRHTDITVRMTAVNLLNWSLLSDLMPVQLARGLGLHLLNQFGPLKRRMIAQGLVPDHTLPRLMRDVATSDNSRTTP